MCAHLLKSNYLNISSFLSPPLDILKQMPDIGPLIEQGMESLFTETESTTRPEIESVTRDSSVSLVTTSQSSQGSSTMMVTSANVDSGVSSTPLNMVSITVTTLSPLSVSLDNADTAEESVAGQDNDNTAEESVAAPDNDSMADNENRDDINSENQENNSDGANEKEGDDGTPLISSVVNDLIPVLQDQEFVQMMINVGPILNIIQNMFFDKPAPNEISI